MYDVKDIKGYVNFDRVLLNPKMYAEKFCEGNTALQQLLLRCWNNNIETLACCIGHEQDEGDYDPAYIMMYISYERKTLIYRILASVYNMENVLMTIGNSCYRGNNNDIFLYISYFDADKIFSAISRAISPKEKIDLADGDKEEIIKIVELINNNRYDSCNLGLDRYNESRYEAFVDYIDVKKRKHVRVISKRYAKDEIKAINYFFSDKQMQKVEAIKRKVR
jgi:hypothetical protein